MPQSGGPAAINGFLYQILNHLAWLANIQVTGSLTELDDPEDLCIILEPKDGGDARCEAAGLYLVEQYKSRPESTWSTKDIIEKVLPDLRKAVPEPPSKKAKYRFVTDGREGRLRSFRDFLSEVRLSDGPQSLDESGHYHFGSGFPLSIRGLFNHVVTKTGSAQEHERADAEKAVFNLLANFEMEFEVSTGYHSNKVERLLRLYAPDLGDEKNIRHQLVGMLMGKLSKGETHITRNILDDFFQEAGLNPERMKNLAALSETLASMVDDELNRVNYNPEKDVRNPPEWPPEKPILLIYGDSGAGKTWQLARLAQNQAESRQPVVWLRAEDNKENTLKEAMRLVWQEGLGETNEKTASALKTHFREMAPNAIMPWLTIAVDDIQDTDLAKILIRQPWTRWGMRLALSVSSTAAKTLQQDRTDTIHFHSVDRFSVDEVDKLFHKCDRSWSRLPRDLQKLLRTPILASIYLCLPYGSFHTSPNSEYEIFKAFWERKDWYTQPGDEGVLLTIAARVLNDQNYPISRPDWHEAGLDESNLHRLQASGWLQCLKGSDVAFAHDRLLNWAVAEELVLQLDNGRHSIKDLENVLAKCSSFTRHYQKKLEYVLMDVLWLLSGDPTRTKDAVAILSSLEERKEYGGHGSDFYKKLIPTLGGRAVPVLMARLDKLISSDENDIRIKFIAESVTQIACQENVDLSVEIEGLLHSRSYSKQSVGISMAAAVPSSRFLDRLWQIHKARVKAPKDKGNKWFVDREASSNALRIGIQNDPGWLRDCITTFYSDQEMVPELAYLLYNLDHPESQSLWKEVKDLLAANTPPNRLRGLMFCIGRFRDITMKDRLIDNLSNTEDLTNAAALSNLVKLDPDKAITRLFDITKNELVATRNWWLPPLLHARPEQTREKLLEMARQDPRGRRLIDDLFIDRADELDQALLNYHLGALEDDLKNKFDSSCQNDPVWLYHPLQLLANISRPDLLDIIAQEAGGKLESMTTKIACSRIPHLSKTRDIILDRVRHLLICIGGNGITELINHELESTNHWGRYGGLNWAFIHPDKKTVQLLTDMANQPVSKDEKGKPDSKTLLERREAKIALAAIGEDKKLVEAIWREEDISVPIDLAELRRDNDPMDKDLTERATTILSDQKTNNNDTFKALIIAWLSADPAFSPLILEVLERAEPDSNIASIACRTLLGLNDLQPHHTKLIVPLLNTEKNWHLAINYLIALEEDGLPCLLSYLRNTPFSKWDRKETEIVLRLYYNFPSIQEKAVPWAVQLCKKGISLHHPYEIAAESYDPDLRERITDKAFEKHFPVFDVTLSALKGLAKYNVEQAFHAIEHQLYSRNNSSVRRLCNLMVQLSPAKAAPKLIDLALERDDWGRSSIADTKILCCF
ncbi:MAG: hypothetical protein ACLFV2_01390 [Desulfurivibrionaceae bacterium]